MNKQLIGNRIEGSRLILGMMRYGDLSIEDLDHIMKKALSMGISVVDHADIYGGGDSETLFGKWLNENPHLREQIVIQTKCGICNGYYDLSKRHILKSAHESLKRLQVETIDVFMLHRPDALMVPEEVADALTTLFRQGAIKNVGVSNMNPYQIQRLQRVLDLPIIANQVQFGLKHTGILDSGLQVNTEFSGASSRTDYLMEFCQLEEITLQAWSPLQFGFFEGNFIDHPQFEQLNLELKAAGLRYGISPEAMAIAWILNHPARMQVLLGTTNISRIEQIEKATQITLDRETWYGLYRAAGNQLP